jgi:hypothetical protein
MRLKSVGAANPLPRHLEALIHFADPGYRTHEIFGQPPCVPAVDASCQRDFPGLVVQLDLGGIQIRIVAEQLPYLLVNLVIGTAMEFRLGSFEAWSRVYFPSCRGRSEPASPQPINRSSIA